MTDKKENIKEFLIDILGTLVGAFLMATATSLFLLPNQLSSGGFAGIATILYYLLKIPMGTTILALNIPLFLFAGYKLGKSFFIKSMVGTISFSVFIDILDKLEPLTFDRFLAFLIEETKGAFPLWLAPVQVKVLPISEKHVEYANKIYEEMFKLGIRVEVDADNEKIGYRIRKAQLEKVPYMLVVGDKEQETNMVAVRSREDGDIGTKTIEEFIKEVQEENEKRDK